MYVEREDDCKLDGISVATTATNSGAADAGGSLLEAFPSAREPIV